MTQVPAAEEETKWALAEARKGTLAVAPGWFRAWPTADEKWSAVNLRGASQVIVNHSREDDRHPNCWTIRAVYGDHAVELRVGPYESKKHAILVAHAVLNVAFAGELPQSSPPLKKGRHPNVENSSFLSSPAG